MFSNNDEKITHLVRLREEYTQRVSKNVEKLTRQIELLGEINVEDVPSNFTTFYNSNLNKKQTADKKIKYNSKILHQ